MTVCIGEPVSWLRLEQFAIDAADPAVAAHVAACPACRQCLASIRGDAVVLPPLAVPARAARPVWWRRWWLAPAMAAAAAAAVLVLVLRPAPPPGPGPSAPAAGERVAIKGIGDVTVELVRDRAGAIAFDARSYAPGDRWKVMISCPPSASGLMTWIAVSVADGLTLDHPLPVSKIACGNRVVVPGAFAVTGDRANRVCARIATKPAGADSAAADGGTACVTLAPEARR